MPKRLVGGQQDWQLRQLGCSSFLLFIVSNTFTDKRCQVANMRSVLTEFYCFQNYHIHFIFFWTNWNVKTKMFILVSFLCQAQLWHNSSWASGVNKNLDDEHIVCLVHFIWFALCFRFHKDWCYICHHNSTTTTEFCFLLLLDEQPSSRYCCTTPLARCSPCQPSGWRLLVDTIANWLKPGWGFADVQ